MRRTTLALSLVLVLVAGAVSLSERPAAAAEPQAGSCTYFRVGSVFMAWDIDDLKRVNVRSDLGWVTRVDAPDTEVRFTNKANASSYFVRAKLTTGEVTDIPCVERPYLQLEVPAATAPFCSIGDSKFGPFLQVVNTLGSLNLRDENGWVYTVDKNEPSGIVAAAKDSYRVVNRNPITGRNDIPCTLGELELLDFNYGGDRTRTIDNVIENGDYEIVELNIAFSEWVIRNNTTGEARYFRTGDADWRPLGVSADGKTIFIDDLGGDGEFEVDLDTAPGELTYYSV